MRTRYHQMMPWKPFAISAKPSVAPTIECVPLTGSPKNVAMNSQPQQPISDDSCPTIRSASRGCAAQSRPKGSGDDEAGHVSHELVLFKSAARVELTMRLKAVVCGDAVLMKSEGVLVIGAGLRWSSSL